MILIAPLSANTLSKISNGLCDNTVTLIIRAIEMKKKFNYKIMNFIFNIFFNIDNIICKKIFLCPAMNTNMYNHPITN